MTTDNTTYIGNLELILTLKLADIVKFMDKFSNSGGPSDLYKDPTSNAIVPNIDIIMNPKGQCSRSGYRR